MKNQTKQNATAQAFYSGMFKRMMGQIETHIEMIDPETAQCYLNSMVDNRKKIKGAIDEYAQSMRDLEWLLSHQGIAFDDQGRLIDGQNRLLAIIATGIAIPMMVTTGLIVDCFKVVDAGRGRKLSQAMHIRKIKNSIECSSIVRTILIYKLSKCTSLQFSPKVTNTVGLDYYYSHTDLIREAIPWAKKFVEYGSGTRATGGFIYYVLATIDKDLAEDFLTKLVMGVGLEENSPIVKHRCEMETLRRKNDGKFPHRNDQANLIFRTWNRWLGKYTKRKTSCAVPYGLMTNVDRLEADKDKVEEYLKERAISGLKSHIGIDCPTIVVKGKVSEERPPTFA